MALNGDLASIFAAAPNSDDDASLRTMWETAKDPGFPGGLLPVRREGRLLVYAVVQDTRSWRELRPLLLAFCGPTISDFRGPYTDLDPKDSFERELALLNPHIVAVLRPGQFYNAEDWLRGSLLRMLERKKAAPKLRTTQKQSTAKLLSLVQDALNGGDISTARGLFSILDSEHRLDAFNLAQLDIKILANARHWSAIRHHHQFDTIRTGGPTSATAEALLEAIYNSDVLNPLEDGPNQNSAETWNDDIASLVRPLLMLVDQSDRQAVEELRRLASGQWLETSPVTEIQSYESDVSSEEKSSTLIEPIQVAHTALMKLTALTDPSQIVVCERRAWDAMHVLDEVEQVEILRSPYLALVWKDLCSKLGEQPPPENWLDWLKALADPEFDSTSYLQTAVEEWRLPDAPVDPAISERLVTAMNSVSGHLATSRLVQALPYLCRWLADDPMWPRASFGEFYQTLLERMAYGEERGEAILNSAAIVLEGVLLTGVSISLYRDTLEATFEIARESLSRRTTLDVLGLAETVIFNPQKDLEAFVSFGSKLVAEFSRFQKEMSLAQRLTLVEFAKAFEIELPEVEVAAETESTLNQRLRGVSVAIYTLTESAGQKACDILSAIAPDASFRLNSDHGGTDSLKSLAKNAELFVMVSRSATHAAFDVIQKYRAEGPLIYAAGKGASSIVRAVENWSAERLP